jgi:prolyl 4-hydroxylase
MLHQCEKLEGPLPFHSVKDVRGPPTGQLLRLERGYPGLWQVHSEPSIFLCDQLLTSVECDALMRLSEPLLRHSLTDSGRSTARTSQSCHLRKGSQPCPSVLRKVQALTAMPIDHMETPQVARYEPGQFYTMHFDGPDESLVPPHLWGEQGGQRVCTVLIYLNDVLNGGRTRFNRLGLEVAPRKGCAVVFLPGCVDTGQLDYRVLHEARPAVDRKYVCQIWIRERQLPPEAREFTGMGHRLLEALHAS